MVTMSPTPLARLSANMPRSVLVSFVHSDAPCISGALSRSAAAEIEIMVRFIGILEGDLNGIRGTDPGAEVLAAFEISDSHGLALGAIAECDGFHADADGAFRGHYIDDLTFPNEWL